MTWMLSSHEECPTCRQPLWDPAAYKMIAATFESSLQEEEDDGILEETADGGRPEEQVDERSQQFGFRLAYFVLAAVVLQILVFTVLISSENHRTPVQDDVTGLNTTSDRTSAACVEPPQRLITNATLRAQCQYTRTCSVPMVGSLPDCQCLCWRYGSLATLYDATMLCVCERGN